MSPSERAEVQRIWLDTFASTGVVLLACRQAGITRQTVDWWKKHDDAFAEAWAWAKEDAKDRVRAEIWRRGVTGWDEDGVRKHSDTLLIFLAKSMMPEFRDRIDIFAEVRRVAIEDGADPDQYVQAAQRLLGPPRD